MNYPEQVKTQLQKGDQCGQGGESGGEIGRDWLVEFGFLLGW